MYFPKLKSLRYLVITEESYQTHLQLSTQSNSPIRSYCKTFMVQQQLRKYVANGKTGITFVKKYLKYLLLVQSDKGSRHPFKQILFPVLGSQR